eukprot:bmy_05002T0
MGGVLSRVSRSVGLLNRNPDLVARPHTHCFSQPLDTEVREGRTRNHGHSVCSTWGDSHYKTFDGDVFRFPGLCDYNFASDCRDAYQEFAVHLKRGPGRSGGHPQVEYILLTVKDDTIYLTSQLTVLNGAITIAEFSRQCSHAGGRPRNWRTASLCPKSCPATMVYLESGSPCMDTCSHLEVSSLCEEHRMDGCFCPEASFSIFQPSSHHLVVTTAFGLRLQVQLVPVMQLFVTLDHAAQGLVQGLCGNYNGLEGDDFKTAGGLVEATGAGFANTWKAQSSCHDKLDWLDDPCSLNIESANYAEHWCSLLKKAETPFGKCHSAVDPAEYYKRCKYDTCNCQSTEDCMCAALSSYARACAIKGVMLWGWRERVCNKDVDSCPRSQVFLYNLTTCQKTCRSLSEPDTHCLKGFAPVDGCGCPDHTFLDQKGLCVPLAKCSCYHRGLYLEAGKVILRQEERCTCQKGRWACTQSVCHGTCAIYGNSHYITFDGKYYDFDGHCSYVAVQDYCGQNSSLGSFSIITEKVPCGTTGVTCSKAIKIFIGRTELKLEDKHRMVIQRDVGHHVAYTTREVGQYLVVETSIGIIVIWDKRTTIFIKLAPSYKGTVCGLCGNFDQRSSNDFTTRDHLVAESELDFGNSWKAAPTCPDVNTTPEPCTQKPHRRSWAEKQCSIIKGPVFGVCHSKVDPKPFYEACVRDTCSCDTGGDCECFCSAVAAYAQECTKEEACVFWRMPDLCPIFCDYYNPPNECQWHYEPCGNRSFETCRTVSGIHSNISVSHLEGKTLNFTRDSPFCYWETCDLNGMVEKHFNICVYTPPPSSPSTPATTTSVTPITPSTTTSTTPTTSTGLCCFWSDWINDDHPRIGSDGGDRETFNRVCRAPRDIECRVAIEPHLSWEELGQEAQCNVSFGFICKNEDQFRNGPFGVCYDYEIRVYCCLLMDECPTTPVTIPTTTPDSNSNHSRDPNRNTHHHFNWASNSDRHHHRDNPHHYHNHRDPNTNNHHHSDRNTTTDHHLHSDSNSDPHH